MSSTDLTAAYQQPAEEDIIPNPRAASALALRWGCAPIRNDPTGANKRNPLRRLGANHDRLDEWCAHRLGSGPFHDKTGTHPTTGIRFGNDDLRRRQRPEV